ncbi:hypothetical protein SAMN02745148_01327 [Modicisalibacter ilicicola DSM 19980]|uniref:Sulfite dehydrogenase (Cytochrome) subunit SorB n=1 Tax=Modicisalibacter ilicicola DSM 19980 TaxID=1121942 RepID=A0A1M4X5J5_9GAMM|nr:hypothetical protein [Halomonas ilicicola]SHE88750.1 hypothetical protein SAMN02745148_01327 [Halomonas ilicicola DSM 19980]
MNIAKRLALTALALPLLAPLPLLAQETDPESGFVIADGWQTVKANCTVCHSAKLVTQNSGSRNHWESLIRWMQDTQGLWQFRPEMEATILDYLAEHYGPKEHARRPPLARDLLPENPYKQEDQASG